MTDAADTSRAMAGSLDPNMRRFAVDTLWGTCRYLQSSLAEQYGCRDVEAADIPRLFTGQAPAEAYSHPLNENLISRHVLKAAHALLGSLIDDMGPEPESDGDP